MSEPQNAVLCIFAKPPQAGMVKTRLGATLGAGRASELAGAFLKDTWRAAQRLAWARTILVTTQRSDFEFELGGVLDRDVWLQGDGDLGQRLQRVLERGLRHAPLVLAIGADTPGLPPRLIEQARVALQTSDAVLGPSDDGGFYLIGLTRCPEGLLQQLPWSSRDTLQRTRDRLTEFGLRSTLLPGWFDIDRESDLDRLQRLLEVSEIIAPATACALGRMLGILDRNA